VAGVWLALSVLALSVLACNFQLGGLPTPAVPFAGSSVMFIAPAANSQLAEGATILLAVRVVDTGAGVTQVDFLINDRVIGSQLTPDGQPLPSFTAMQPWQAEGLRGHLVSAIARRADDTVIGRAEMTIQVVAATYAPLAPTVQTPVGGTPTLTIPTTSTRPSIATNTPADSSSGAGSAGTGGSDNLPILRVTTATLNVRSGPGTTFSAITTLNAGDEAVILGRNDTRTWWFIERNRVRGWVTSDSTFSTVRGDTSTVPFVRTASQPLPTTTPVRDQTLAPTSTVAAFADLVIDSFTLTPATPLVNQTFYVTITVRNQGALDAGPSLLSGLFQPGNERSDMGVPAIPAGQSVTLPPLYVTLEQAGANQIGVFTLDYRGEVREGPDGEANNLRTFTYEVR
jgi:hypothetical protein